MVSGQDDEFAGGASGFHVGVCFGDVVEAVGAMDRDDGVAGCDVVEEVPEDMGGEVGGVSAVGGEADAAWEVLDRSTGISEGINWEYPRPARV